MTNSSWVSVEHLVRAADPERRVEPLTDDERVIMRRGVDTLDAALEAGTGVYGVTHGFGALVDHPGGGLGAGNGAALINHLATGQGHPLDPETCRLAVWLRLASMRQGYSAVTSEQWEALARIHNAGFVPAMPSAGTVSASGDLQPLASAALAFAGEGRAWLQSAGEWALVEAREALRALGCAPVSWHSRQALAFVNGTSVSLAVTLLNHHELRRQTEAGAALTARVVEVLGAGSEPFHPGIAAVRRQIGQAEVARWIRDLLPAEHPHRPPDRPLQEVYSIRGASQVLGAVLDQLSALERILVAESVGTTDNPVCVDGQVLHGANFHALPVGLASDQLGLCAQQVAYLAERQLNVLCNPQLNGGLPVMLAATPGLTSGLAGVQISATSFVSSIRQRVLPASLTTLPTNGVNQDHVSMALVGALAVREALITSRWVLGSLAVATAQHAALTGRRCEGVWARIAELAPPLRDDRPLADEVRLCGDLLATTSILTDPYHLDEGSPRTDAATVRAGTFQADLATGRPA